MFRSNYQGGAVVEVFSGQGKDPVARWKLSGGSSAIQKEYNKEVKGFVYCLEGSSQTVKMQMPENGKTSLGLLQRFLVLQVNIPHGKDFSIELVITDSEHMKRRLYFSTVHKELTATLLHARIPFVGLKRDIWSTLCMDLVSFTAGLFKGFLKLDGITLFATCKVRRIFTMKSEPAGMSDDVMFLSGAGLMDLIPRSCQFPSDVNHVTQILNMKNMQKSDMRTVRENSECGSDQTVTARSTSHQPTRPQGVLHTASGSRPSVRLPQTGKKSSTAPGGMNRSELFISNTGSPFSRINRKVFTESQSIANLSDNSHGEPNPALHKDALPGPSEKQLTWKQAIEAHSDVLPGCNRNKSKSREKHTPSSTGQESRQRPLTGTDKTEHGTADKFYFSSAKESFRSAPTTAESLSDWTRPDLSSDPQPHSPKRGQGQGDQEKVEMGDDQRQSKSGRRHEAQPEDDFIGSESDEDKSNTTMQQQQTSESIPATPRTPDPTLNMRHKARPKLPNMDHTFLKVLCPATSNIHIQSLSIGGAEPAAMAPTHCLSPSVTTSRQEHKCGPRASEGANQVQNGNNRVTISRSLLQEVKMDDSPLDKEEDEPIHKPVDSSHYDLQHLGSLRMHGDDDDEELRMLASLKREQEEDECSASGLSASQIHQCNVSISMSSDDASTWTHITMPANQGPHYQNEMNPLLHSDPREWMDVLSPPIMPPSQPRRSGNTWNNWENLVGGGDEEELEDEYLNLHYDSCLNCYFDPNTGKYYELA
ncbi:protein CFAP20DC isoform X2 [Paralichthys olivaceus]|uniref:protein CFAP20DC isoform X2 n=1 Tax=Paralichthys olivaceus TaxID=8255 RepID=UPI0037512DC2